MEPGIVYIINRSSMLGLHISRRCTAHFNDELCLKFTTEDLESTGPRIKHNISGLTLPRPSCSANKRLSDEKLYEKIIEDEKPHLYLKMSERRGVALLTTEARQTHLSGYYSLPVRCF